MTLDVRLRDVTADDLPVFFEHQLDSEATAMAAFPSREREPFMAHWTKILTDETAVAQTILVDGQVAGNVVCFYQGGKREVGYWLGRAFWGKGIATKALSLLLEQVTERPLYAHVAKHNVGSLRVLEKCGFTITGQDRWFPESLDKEVEEHILTLNAIAGDDTSVRR